MGCYIYGDFNSVNIEYGKGGRLTLRSSTLIHEYGHYLQGRAWGSFGSLLSGINSSSYNKETDSRAWSERDASLRGMNYFSNKGFSMSGYGGLNWGEQISRQKVNFDWMRYILFF